QHIKLNEGTIRFEIIGVVGHIKHLSWEGDAHSKVRYQMYSNYNQIPDEWFAQVTRTMSLVALSKSDTATLIPAMRRQVAHVDSDQSIYNLKLMDDLISNSMSQQRFAMALLVVFAAVAILLAGVGIYGVTSYSVTQRSHEIGIRMALGARRGDVLNMVVTQLLRLVLIGVAIGLGGAFALTRVMTGLLFGVSATDPITFLITSLGLTGVAVGAPFFPPPTANQRGHKVAVAGVVVP